VPRVKIIQRPRADAPGYFRKAEQFCLAATAALAQDRYDAAMLCAVHAGISCADAVCVGLGGRRSGDPDHMRAADLLETVGASSPPIKEKAQLLRSLNQLKNRVEYEDKPATRDDAEAAAKRCERLVSWAKEELSRARLLPTP
jgi:HEPN domain-containing protein